MKIILSKGMRILQDMKTASAYTKYNQKIDLLNPKHQTVLQNKQLNKTNTK